MASIRAVKFTPDQQQRYRQIGQIAAYSDSELGPILRREVGELMDHDQPDETRQAVRLETENT